MRAILCGFAFSTVAIAASAQPRYTTLDLLADDLGIRAVIPEDLAHRLIVVAAEPGEPEVIFDGVVRALGLASISGESGWYVHGSMPTHPDVRTDQQVVRWKLAAWTSLLPKVRSRDEMIRLITDIEQRGSHPDREQMWQYDFLRQIKNADLPAALLEAAVIAGPDRIIQCLSQRPSESSIQIPLSSYSEETQADIARVMEEQHADRLIEMGSTSLQIEYSTGRELVLRLAIPLVVSQPAIFGSRTLSLNRIASPIEARMPLAFAFAVSEMPESLANEPVDAIEPGQSVQMAIYEALARHGSFAAWVPPSKVVMGRTGEARTLKELLSVCVQTGRNLHPAGNSSPVTTNHGGWRGIEWVHLDAVSSQVRWSGLIAKLEPLLYDREVTPESLFAMAAALTEEEAEHVSRIRFETAAVPESLIFFSSTAELLRLAALQKPGAQKGEVALADLPGFKPEIFHRYADFPRSRPATGIVLEQMREHQGAVLKWEAFEGLTGRFFEVIVADEKENTLGRRHLLKIGPPATPQP